MASVSGRRARVTFDYEPEQLDELRLTVGDIIEDVVDEDDGWCKGMLNGKVGLFPNNFVEFLSKAADVPAPTPTPAPAPAPADSDLSKDSLAGKKAKVGFDYEAENADELSIKVGEIVEILREVEDGWWEGTIHGNTGVFPSNFVELVEETEGPPPLPEKEVIHPEPATQGEESKPSVMQDEEDASNKRSSIFGQNKMMGGGMGFGNLISADILSGTRLKKVDPKKKVDPPEQKAPAAVPTPMNKGGSMKRKAPPVPPVPTTATTAPAKKAVGKAKVLFEYNQVNDDELSLKVGDIVTVINQEVYDTDGWWEGELNGKVGLFPDNFVELLPDEEPAKESPKTAKKVPPAPVAGHQEKRAPPPAPTEEEIRPRTSSEPPKKDMKKVPEPKKLPHHETEPTKPHLPPKKLVPPKPLSKPSVLPKKPVPKPPPKAVPKPGPKEPEMNNRLNKTAPGIMEGIAKAAASSSEECNLDAVEKHEMLDHLTKNRAKLQNKRPPSTVRISEGNLFDLNAREEPEGEKEEKPVSVEPTEPAWKKEARERREAKESKEKVVHSAPPTKEKRPLIFDKQETNTSPTQLRKSVEQPTKATDAASADEISSLRKEVSDLKTLVEQMKKQMDAMQHKHEEDVKKLDKRLKKEIEQLTEDFDEQRNKYAKLEIDFDRLKKKRRRESGDADE